MIHDFGIKLRFDIGPAVCDGRIRGVQLQIGNTIGNTAQGEGLCNIGKGLAVFLFPLYQSGKAKILQVIKPLLRSNVGQCLYGDDVQGIPDTIPQGTGSPVTGAVPVGNRTSLCIIKGSINKYIRQSKPGAV